MIELRNLCKQFGRFTAVRNLDLTIVQGEIFGFIGPNGAGKTTTIRMMGGILAPTRGSVTINGVPMARQPEQAKRQIGFIPAQPFLYEKLSGYEFMRFCGDLYQVPRRIQADRIDALLAQFKLETRDRELIESYSHGMRQRLVMASALLHDPAVLIVDEPMVGLDPSGIRMVKDLFRDLARKGKAIFMSTHTLGVAEAVCHRIGVINKGRLAALGSAAELQAQAALGGGAEAGDLEQIFIRLTEEKTQ